MNNQKINYSRLFDKLYPIPRSILGEGFRNSLNIISKYIKLKKFKYKSGKKIYDWVVPKEWILKNAYIKFKGKKILDVKNNHLHVIGYSKKIRKKINQKLLKKNIYSLKNSPNYIPYVTSYYQRNWGFCMKHSQKVSLKPGNYDCLIDTEFKNGYLVNGLGVLKGKSKKINLITTYLCHPNLANNELSGPLIMIGLYNRIKKWKFRNFTYNFLINPETIGTLCFLHSHGKKIKKNFNAGLVLTCLGGPKNKLSYKMSKNGQSTLDNIFKLLENIKKVKIRKFTLTGGSDERQYNSPGFELPVGNICRTVYGSYPEYHSSGDDKKFVRINKIEQTIDELDNILQLHDLCLPLKRYVPYGEPMLGKRNLYPNINTYETRNNSSSDTQSDNKEQKNILLNILGYSDGKNNILDIIKMKNLNMEKSFKILKICLNSKLIKFSY